MAIAYPLALPITSGIKRIDFSALSTVAVTRSPFTLAQQVQKFPGQLWGVDVTLAKMSIEEAGVWQAFLLSLNGQEGTFLVGDPIRPEPRGTALGTPLVNGAGQLGNELVTDGWDANETGLLLPGDLIQLQGTRMYQVLKQVNSDGGGNATIDIWPNLRTATVDNEPLILNNVKGLFRLASADENVQSVDQTKAINLSFSGVEAL